MPATLFVRQITRDWPLPICRPALAFARENGRNDCQTGTRTEWPWRAHPCGLGCRRGAGRKGGRKPAVTEDKLRRTREHIAERLAVHEAAVRMKIGKTALYQALTLEGA